MLQELIKELSAFEDDAKKKSLSRFFKKDEKHNLDLFLGVPVPIQRKLVDKYYSFLSFEDIQKLLSSKYHEHKMTGVLVLIKKYEKSKKDKFVQRKIFEFYLKNLSYINNWDLIDVSAPKIIGNFSINYGEDVMRDLAKSNNFWERRVAIVSTYAFIKQRNFGETLAISKMLLEDNNELVCKATGWMLREVGKRNKNILEIFLIANYKKMSRVTLRYAIEKFPEIERKKWLEGKIN